MRFSFKSALLSLVLSISCACASAIEISGELKADLLQAGLSRRAIRVMNEKIRESRYPRSRVAIVDYTLSSTKPRFFVIDMSHHQFNAYKVSHGVKSGGENAVSFSNEPDSHKSSLGFIRTDIEASGSFGRSLRLTGLSPSNSNLNKRAIILHSAEYASEAFQKKYKMFGRSFGCLAVDQKDVDAIIDSLGSKALILAYHDKLWDKARKSPMAQDLDEPDQKRPSTLWESAENKHGDPQRHKRGDAPTSHYKALYGSFCTNS